MQVVIKVILYRVSYTVCYISHEHLLLSDKQYYKEIGLEDGGVGDVLNNVKIGDKKGSLRCTTNALFLQPFAKCLRSDVYRTKVIENLNRLCGWPTSRSVQLKLILEPPDLEIIDYLWNERILRLLWTRVEIENAFSWLSTLGGAYSALGDYFEHCAEEAGRISLRQYKLSRMLGDDALAARSKLYSALALAQKGRLHAARHIVRKINEFSIRTHDKRLNRMCLGVWAKLKYMHSLKHSPIQGSQGEGNNKTVIVK